MKQYTFFLLVILFVTRLTAGEHNNQPVVIVDITYASRYIDKGTDVFANNHSVLMPGIGIDLFATGFGISVVGFHANSGGFENAFKMEHSVYYETEFLEDSPLATECLIAWAYSNFPDNPRKAADTQEIETFFSWPNIGPKNIVPYYLVSAEWPVTGNAGNRKTGGWIHIFGINYDFNIPHPLRPIKTHPLTLSAEIAYNDGTGGEKIDHDWSHAVLGLSTAFEIAKGTSLNCGMYWQSSWEDSVNKSDEVWFSAGVRHEF